MSFFMLKHLASTDIVTRKERIDLVVNYSIQSILIFFRDKTFQHYDRHTSKVIKEGTLSFLPYEHLESRIRGRVVLLGYDDNQHQVMVCIKVEQDYALEMRQIFNVKAELTTKHYLFQPRESKKMYLIRVVKNIQNGISVQAFDFHDKLWQQQLLYLNSKFLQAIFIDTSFDDKPYKEQSQAQCHTFVLLSPGDRFQSLQYSKIKLVYQGKGQAASLKLKFVLTRQIRMKNHFVVMGGMWIENNRLLLIGSGKIDSNNVNDIHHTVATAIVDMRSVQLDQPQNVVVKKAFKPESMQEDIMIKRFVGVHQGNMIGIVRLTDKKWTIVRVNQEHSQMIIQFQMLQPPKLALSCLKDCLYLYSSKLQNFFQRLKVEPSVLEFDLFKIQAKHQNYRKLLKVKYPCLSPNMVDLTISLL